MLFERLVVQDDRVAASAALNMAVDEALLESVAHPVLRFYRWERSSLSFGYFGKFADVADQAKTHDIVRRWTGGGIVPHGEDLTYSLVTPASDPASTRGPRAIYLALHKAIRTALFAEGRESQLATHATPKVSEACFANPVRGDLLCDGRKVAGAAQRRTRRGFLHQGSVQLPGLTKRFRERFASTLAGQTQNEKMPQSVRHQAIILAAEKYATDAWLHRW